MLLLLALPLWSLMAGCAAAPEEPAPRTRLVLLGTGNPNADPDRSGPAVAVVVDSIPYLIDAGPGVVRRAAAAAIAGVEALTADRLDKLFLTHLHSDHTVGLPDLIFSSAVLERGRPLEIWGPPGTQAMVDHLLAAWQLDIAVRIDGLEPALPAGYVVIVHELDPTTFAAGPVYEDDNVRVTAFRVTHGAWEHAYGYRFDTPDLSVVISGDTVPDEDVVDACDGCDILVHEVISDAGLAHRSPEWQRYHAASHTLASDLGRLAGRARPALLVLYHQLYSGSSDEELLAEVMAVYDGAVVSGSDLQVFSAATIPGRR